MNSFSSRIREQRQHRNLGIESLENRRVLSGTSWFEHVELSATGNFADGDKMGVSMAIDHDVIVAGAPTLSPSSPNSGAADVYVRNDQGTPTDVADDTWVRRADLSGSGIAGSRFGFAVDVDGDTVVVKEVYEQDSQGGGEVHVFVRERNGTSDPLDDTWAKQWSTRHVNSTADHYGARIRIDGNTIVAPIKQADDAGEDTGAVLVYRRDGTTWFQEAELTASDPTVGANFGAGIAIEGNVLIVGADFDHADGKTGATYVFVRGDNGTPNDLTDDAWVETGILQASDPADGLGFGWWAELDGDTLAISAPAIRSTPDPGRVYLFSRDDHGTASEFDDTWTEFAKIHAADGEIGDQFGRGVSIDGDRMAIGAFQGTVHQDNTGSIYVFERDDQGTSNRVDDTWTEVAELAATDGQSGDGIGNPRSLDLQGDEIVSGNAGHDHNGAESGGAHVFVHATTQSRQPFVNATSQQISDARKKQARVTTSQLAVNEVGTLLDVDVRLDIDHSRLSDLDIVLVAPDGTTQIPLVANLSGADLSGTILDDSSDRDVTSGSAPFQRSFRPTGSLADLNGMELEGNWTLRITDYQRSGTGTLNSWSLIARYEFPTPSLSIDDVSVNESDNAAFTVALSQPLDTPTTVGYSTVEGTATENIDYTGTSGSVTFAPGETSKTIVVPIANDSDEESDETFTVTLANPLGEDVVGQATILDDDALVTISISDTTVTEGDTTTVFLDEFVKADDGGLDGPRAVVLGPDGHLYVSSSFTDEVLRYDGNTGQFIDVFVTADSDVLDKPIPLLFGPDGNLYVGGNLSDNVLRFDGATGELIDEFVSSGSGGLKFPKGMVFGPDGDLYVSSADGNGQNTPFDEVLRYSGTSGEFIDVFVTDASGGLDNPNGVAFGPDGHFYVANTTGDSINRYDGATGEFLDVLVAAGTGGLDTPTFMEFRADGNLYVAGQATDAILVFDATSGAMVNSISGGGLDGTGGFAFDPDGDLFVASSQTNNILRFGPASTASLTVSLSSSSAEPVTVDFDTGDGTALAAADYAATSGTMVFEPGVTTQTITVPTINDAMEESTESFSVNLLAASGATIQDGQAQVTILDDDAPTNPNTIYVYDIRFESKRRDRDWRAVFEIRDQDSNPISGVQIEVTFAGNTYTGTTDSNGIFRTSWIRNLSSGNHYAEAADLAFANHDWDQDLGWSEDYDGDGLPDALLEN